MMCWVRVHERISLKLYNNPMIVGFWRVFKCVFTPFKLHNHKYCRCTRS